MEDFFRWTVIGMSPIGLWPLPNRPLTEFRKFTVCLIYNFFTIYVIAAEINQIVDYSGNIVLIAETMEMLCNHLITVLKNASFIYRRDFVRKLLAIIEDLYENVPLTNMDERITATTLKWKKRTHITAKILLSLYVSTALLYLIDPALRLFQGIKELPFPSKFPYDITKLKYFVPTIIIEWYVNLGIVFVFLGAESFFFSVIMFICSRIELLQYSIEAATEEVIAEKKTTALFGVCVEYHKKILKVCEMLQDLYSFSLIVQFLSSTIFICTICFLLMEGDNDINIKIKFFFCLISLFSQLFIYCSFGQLLENQFESLGVNWHQNAWYNAPVSYQKDIRFYMAQCIRPVTFTAYKIMPVNVQTFFTICKTSVSYVAILQRMHDEET